MWLQNGEDWLDSEINVQSHKQNNKSPYNLSRDDENLLQHESMQCFLHQSYLHFVISKWCENWRHFSFDQIPMLHIKRII